MEAPNFPYTWWSGPLKNALYSLRVRENPLITILKKNKESNVIKHTFFYVFMLITPTKKYDKPKMSHMSTYVCIETKNKNKPT